MDKGQLVTVLNDAGLDPRISGASHHYNVERLVPIVLDWKLSKTQSSADRRNDAQAHKSEIESQILLGRYIPIEEAAEIHRELFGALNRLIHEMQLPDEEKERIIAVIKSVSNSENAKDQER